MFKKALASVKSAAADYKKFLLTMQFCYVCSFPVSEEVMHEIEHEKVCPRCYGKIEEMMNL